MFEVIPKSAWSPNVQIMHRKTNPKGRTTPRTLRKLSARMNTMTTITIGMRRFRSLFM